MSKENLSALRFIALAAIGLISFIGGSYEHAMIYIRGWIIFWGIFEISVAYGNYKDKKK